MIKLIKSWYYFNKNYKQHCKHWFDENRTLWFEKFGWQFLYLYMFIRFVITRKPSLLLCNHLVTSFCTLKCKECCCFIPYYKKEGQLLPLSFEKFKTELDLLLESVDLVYRFTFMGGEPFMVKDLPKMMEYAASKSQIQHIYCATNGTLIPSKELINVAKNNKKIIISISNYLANEGLKPALKSNGLVTLFNLNKVQCSLSNTDDLIWHSRQNFFDKNTGSQKAEKNYAMCGAIYCTTYMEGKLYLCQVCAYLDRNMEGFEIEQNEYVNILNNQNAKKNLIKFWQNKYFEVCGWCKCNFKRVEIAEQLADNKEKIEAI